MRTLLRAHTLLLSLTLKHPPHPSNGNNLQTLEGINITTLDNTPIKLI